MKKLLIGVSLVLGGCASAATVKKGVGNDLLQLVTQNNCESLASDLRLYISSQLGVPIPPPAPAQN